MALSGTNLYVANFRQNSIAKINTTTGAGNADFITTSNGPLAYPYALAVSDGHLFVGGNGEGVNTYNATTGGMIKAAFVSVNEPHGIAIYGNTLYVASYHDFVIYEVNATTGAKLNDSITLNSAPFNITVEPAIKQ